MAALSDYLEEQLLNHVFRTDTMSKPSTIAIALTSGVPLDSDTGASIPELPSGVTVGSDTRSTNYQRLVVGTPNNNHWSAVGVDPDTAYSVYRVSSTPEDSGYFFPLYLNSGVAASKTQSANTSKLHTFPEFPSIQFFAPSDNENLAQSQDPGYPIYEGNGFIKNVADHSFASALTDWGWVSGIAIVDHATIGSGNVLMYAKLTNPRYVYTGDNIKFDEKSLEISLK